MVPSPLMPNILLLHRRVPSSNQFKYVNSILKIAWLQIWKMKGLGFGELNNLQWVYTKTSMLDFESRFFFNLIKSSDRIVCCKDLHLPIQYLLNIPQSNWFLSVSQERLKSFGKYGIKYEESNQKEGKRSKRSCKMMIM